MEGRKTTVHTTRTETQSHWVCDVTTKVHIPKPNHLGSVMLLESIVCIQCSMNEYYVHLEVPAGKTVGFKIPVTVLSYTLPIQLCILRTTVASSIISIQYCAGLAAVVLPAVLPAVHVEVSCHWYFHVPHTKKDSDQLTRSNPSLFRPRASIPRTGSSCASCQRSSWPPSSPWDLSTSQCPSRSSRNARPQLTGRSRAPMPPPPPTRPRTMTRTA